MFVAKFKIYFTVHYLEFKTLQIENQASIDYYCKVEGIGAIYIIQMLLLVDRLLRFHLHGGRLGHQLISS